MHKSKYCQVMLTNCAWITRSVTNYNGRPSPPVGIKSPHHFKFVKLVNILPQTMRTVPFQERQKQQLSQALHQKSARPSQFPSRL